MKDDYIQPKSQAEFLDMYMGLYERAVLIASISILVNIGMGIALFIVLSK